MDHNDSLTDLEYITHMIPHHQIAVDMSEQLILQTKIPSVFGLCRDVIRTQKYEIWELENVKRLYEYSSSPPVIVDKKVNTEKITDKEYLQHMIPHHQIAIDMSEKLLLYTNNTYLVTLCIKVIIQQKGEIIIMRELLGKNAFLFKSTLLN